jgi:hypothetical protein
MANAAPEEGKSALKTALECAYDLLLQKIISNPNDMMGILLFGTVKCVIVVFNYCRNKQRWRETTPIYIL